MNYEITFRNLINKEISSVFTRPSSLDSCTSFPNDSAYASGLNSAGASYQNLFDVIIPESTTSNENVSSVDDPLKKTDLFESSIQTTIVKSQQTLLKRNVQQSNELLQKSPNKRFPKPEKYKTAMCLAFLEKRDCRFGENCAFAHGKSELRLFEVPVDNPKYKTKLCKNYESKGICPHGSQCIFIHLDTECENNENQIRVKSNKEEKKENNWRRRRLQNSATASLNLAGNNLSTGRERISNYDSTCDSSVLCPKSGPPPSWPLEPEEFYMRKRVEQEFLAQKCDKEKFPIKKTTKELIEKEADELLNKGLFDFVDLFLFSTVPQNTEIQLSTVKAKEVYIERLDIDGLIATDS